MSTENKVEAEFVELEAKWKRLAGRDLQLWSIGFLVMLIMVSGVLSQVAPALFQGQANLKVEYKYLPTLSLGLVALVLLLNFYLISQRRALDVVRYDLIQEMVRSKSLQQVAMIDPQTQFFSRSAMMRVMSSEISRAHRYGTEITFVILEARDFEKCRKKGNPLTADRMILEVAEILRQTFRGSDTLFRYSKAEFLVVMPKTSNKEAVPALLRLVDNLDHWNMSSDATFELALDYGVSAYDREEPLDVALQRAASNKTNLLAIRETGEPDVRGRAEKSETRQAYV